jgi:hypothetical protein
MIITDQKIYSGEFIHNRFAYTYFRDKISATGNIVAFVSPVNVETSGMIDREDLLSNDFIYSERMINFCWEIPCIHDGFGAVAFQRLFNTGLADILGKYIKVPIIVDGDDIMVLNEHRGGGIIQQKGKASVSITHMIGSVAIGHTGINIVAGDKAPAFAYSTDMNDNQVLGFINDTIHYFNWLTHDIFVASAKVI